MTGGRGGAVFRLSALALGFGFLYLPIAVLVAALAIPILLAQKFLAQERAA